MSVLSDNGFTESMWLYITHSVMVYHAMASEGSKVTHIQKKVNKSQIIDFITLYTQLYIHISCCFSLWFC